MRLFVAAALTLLATPLATPLAARTALGTYDRWGAFRDEAPPRCFAIARAGQGGPGAFATVSAWPRAGVRGQVYLRLSRAVRPGAAIVLRVDDRRIALVGAQSNAWSADARADAAIVAAMRSARGMSVASVAATGGAFADSYTLKGAATAIDAATIACARG